MNSIHLSEELLPGLGQRFRLELRPGDPLDVIVLRDGRRQLARPSPDGDEAEILLDLDRDQAVTVGALLLGASISQADPADVSATQHSDDPADEVAVETVTLTERSPVLGRSAVDALDGFGDDAVALAVIRDRTPEIVEHDPAVPLADGDRLAFAAKRGHHGDIVAALTNNNGSSPVH